MINHVYSIQLMYVFVYCLSIFVERIFSLLSRWWEWFRCRGGAGENGDYLDTKCYLQPYLLINRTHTHTQGSDGSAVTHTPRLPHSGVVVLGFWEWRSSISSCTQITAIWGILGKFSKDVWGTVTGPPSLALQCFVRPQHLPVYASIFLRLLALSRALSIPVWC